MSLSNEEIALELVKIEKEKPSSNEVKEAVVLYEAYVKHVYKCYKERNQNQ